MTLLEQAEHWKKYIALLISDGHQDFFAGVFGAFWSSLQEQQTDHPTIGQLLRASAFAADWIEQQPERPNWQVVLTSGGFNLLFILSKKPEHRSPEEQVLASVLEQLKETALALPVPKQVVQTAPEAEN